MVFQSYWKLIKVPSDFKVSDVAVLGPQYRVVERMIGMEAILVACTGDMAPTLPDAWVEKGIQVRGYTLNGLPEGDTCDSKTVMVHFFRTSPPSLSEALLCLHGMGFPVAELESVAIAESKSRRAARTKKNRSFLIYVSMLSDAAAQEMVPSRCGVVPFLPRWDGHYCTETKACVHVLQLQKLNHQSKRKYGETSCQWLSTHRVRGGAVTLADEAKRVFFAQRKVAVWAVGAGEIPALIASSPPSAPAPPAQSPIKEMPGLVSLRRTQMALETEVETVLDMGPEMPDLSIDGSDTTDTSVKRESKVSRTLPSAEMHHDLVTTTCMPIFHSAEVHNYKSDEEENDVTNKCASSDSDGAASSPDSESTVRVQGCQTDLDMEEVDQLEKLAAMIKVHL